MIEMKGAKYSYKLIEEEDTFTLLIIKDGAAMEFDIKDFIALGKSVLKLMKRVFDEKEINTFPDKLNNALKNWGIRKK